MVARQQRALHLSIVAAALLPAAWLPVALVTDRLGANPIESITHMTGDWALRLLLLSLAVTPLRRRLGWAALARYRRSFGLLAFGYATLHLATWLALDHAFDFAAIGEDVLERPFVTAGMGAFALLLPLAATSTRAAMRRLGRRWITLHRTVYAAAGLAVLHYFWLVKADLRGPLVHAAVLAVLLAARLPRLGRRARANTT